MTVSIVWFDPGETTGVFKCNVKTEWLAGKGDGGWKSLGGSLLNLRYEQVGITQRVYRPKHNRNVLHGRPEKSYVDLSSVTGGLLEPYQTSELSIISRCFQLLQIHEDSAWGYEDFIPRSLNQSRAFLSPVRLFSSLTTLEILNGSQRAPFVQSAAMAKQTATDDRLKLAGLYKPGIPHAIDATRHVTTFLRRARQDIEFRHLAWPHINWS